MLRIGQARAIPRALRVLLALSFAAAGCGAASAKSRIKRPAPEQPSAESLYAGARSSARFFTINAVLAKHDGLSRSSAGSVQVASADASVPVGSDLVGDFPAAVAVAALGSEEPFGVFSFRAPEGLLWAKWRAVEARMRADTKSIEACKSDDRQCTAAARKFIALTQFGVADIRSGVEGINRQVNQAVRYLSDFEHYGVADFWNSPLETLAAGAGDCEDYAIVKFAALLHAGMPESDLKVLLVRDTTVRQDHAVLAVRIGGRWVVLDNRHSGLLETSDLPHFVPLFAIDQGGVNLFAAPYAERPRHESEIDVLPAADMAGVAAGQTLPLLF